MQEAGLMNFLRTILIILLIYYISKFILRLAFPVMMNKFMKNVERKFQEQQGYHTNKNQNQKVGETTIDKAPNAKKGNNEVGEYIDFEEID